MTYVWQAYFVSVDGLAYPIPQQDATQATALAACAEWRDRPTFVVCASVPHGVRRGDVPVVVNTGACAGGSGICGAER